VAKEAIGTAAAVVGASAKVGRGAATGTTDGPLEDGEIRPF
jgi:hypothetical protein